MAQYINKSALGAEIDNRIYRRKKEYNILEESEIWEDALKLKERINELVDLRTQVLFNTLDTIEVKEVDLEQEIQ